MASLNRELQWAPVGVQPFVVPTADLLETECISGWLTVRSLQLAIIANLNFKQSAIALLTPVSLPASL